MMRTALSGAAKPAIAAIVALVLGGCAAKRGAEVTYHDPNMDFSLVRTVAVLPFENLTTETNAAQRVRDVFMTMLQATGAVYVLPPGEVARGLARANVQDPAHPNADEVKQLGTILSCDVVCTGTVREYGEVRSGTSAANLVSLSVEMLEVQTGRVVWSASATKGGISTSDRVFGGGGQPMNVVTEEAARDLLDKLFGK